MAEELQLPDAPTLPPPERAWKTFLIANRFFLIGVLLLLLFNVYVLATNNQGDVLIAINKMRRNWSDTLFIYGTRLGEPIAYVIVGIGLAAVRYRTALFMILAGVLAGVLTGILKGIFAEARPMRWFFDNYEGIWHSLNLFHEGMRNWGYTSFPSGHSASAFALYSFLCFNLRRPKVLVSILCFLLAAQVGFSRMYLLFHFLRDVTVGAALGLLIGIGVYFLQFKVFPNTAWLDRGWWPRKDHA